MRSDLQILAGRRQLDHGQADQGRRVAKALQGFYDGAAAAIDNAMTNEVTVENDRLVRALKRMGQIMRTDGKVAFRSDTDAARFGEDLRARYGEGVVQEFASGNTGALASDVEESLEL